MNKKNLDSFVKTANDMNDALIPLIQKQNKVSIYCNIFNIILTSVVKLLKVLIGLYVTVKLIKTQFNKNSGHDIVSQLVDFIITQENPINIAVLCLFAGFVYFVKHRYK